MNLLAIISLLAIVESSNNPNAHNLKEDAKGILQIRSIMIRDINRVYKSNFQHNDAFDPEMSKGLALNYFMHYHKPNKQGLYDAEQVAKSWNGGGNWRNSDKEKQRKLNNYWAKVKRLIK